MIRCWIGLSREELSLFGTAPRHTSRAHPGFLVHIPVAVCLLGRSTRLCISQPGSRRDVQRMVDLMNLSDVTLFPGQ